MKVNFRQGIVSHQDGGCFQINGGNVDILADSRSLTVTIADQYTNYTSSEDNSIVAAWPAPFSPDSEWLYFDFNTLTFERTFGSTLLEPVVQSTAPTSSETDSNNIPLLTDGRMWYNTATNVQSVLSSNIWVKVNRVFAAKIIGGITLVSMGQNSNIPGDFTGTQVGNNNPIFSGRVLFPSETPSAPITRTDGTFLTTEDQFFTNQSRVDGLRLESNVTRAEFKGGGSLAAFSVVAWTSSGEIQAATYDNVGTTVVGLLTEVVATDQTGGIIVQGSVTNSAWTWTSGVGAVSVGSALWVDNGLLVTEDPHVVGPVMYPEKQVPVARVLSDDTVIFEQGLGGVGPVGPAGTSIDNLPIANTSDLGAVTLLTPSSDPARAFVISDNDSRLADARAPLPHPHQAIDITFTPGGGVLSSDLQNAVVELGSTKLNLSGGTMSGLLTLASQPLNDFDATTKRYVDALFQGIDVKDACTTATTAPNGDIGGTYDSVAGTGGTGAITGADITKLDGVDGVDFNLVVGTRLLIKDQTDAKQNGIYVITVLSSPTMDIERSADFDSDDDIRPGNYTLVRQGATQPGSGWALLDDHEPNDIQLNIHDILWGLVSAAASYFGDPNTINIDGSNVISVIPASSGGTVDALQWNSTSLNLTGIVDGMSLVYDSGTSSFKPSSFSFPSTNGNAGDVIVSDGVGNTSWQTAAQQTPWLSDIDSAGFDLNAGNAPSLQLLQGGTVHDIRITGIILNSIGKVILHSEEQILLQPLNGGANTGQPSLKLDVSAGISMVTDELNIRGFGSVPAEVILGLNTGTITTTIKQANTSGQVLFQLPPDNGSAGDVLTNLAGDGVMTWEAGASSNNWLTANSGNDFATAPIATGIGNPIALGNAATAGQFGLAIGLSAVAGAYGTAIGLYTTAGIAAIAIGDAKATATRGIAIGSKSMAPEQNSIALGAAVVTSQISQVLIGDGIDSASAPSDLPYAVKIGYDLSADVGGNKQLLHLHSKGKLELVGDEAQFVMPSYPDVDTTPPAAGIAGGLVYDVTSTSLRLYDGTNWNAVGGGASNNWLTANGGVDFATAPIATGTNSIAIGNNATTGDKIDSIAIGNGAVASSFLGATNNIAIGTATIADSDRSIAIGNAASAKTLFDICIGDNASALGDAVGRNIVIGSAAYTATGSKHIVIGSASKVTGTGVYKCVVAGDFASSAETEQVVIGSAMSPTSVTTDVPYSVKIGTVPGDIANTNFLHLHSKGKLELYGDEAQFILPNYITASEPVTTDIGGMIYDTTTNELKINDGTNWNAVGGSGGVTAPQYEKQIILAVSAVVNTTLPTTATGADTGGTSSLQVYRNGMLQEEKTGGGLPTTEDFGVTGANQITFVASLTINDKIIIYSFE